MAQTGLTLTPNAFCPIFGTRTHRPRKGPHKQTNTAASPQCPAPIAPLLFMVGSGCWEPRVSRFALIDDSICSSFPVKALNSGWRESFGYEERRASPVSVCCSWSCSQLLSQPERRCAGSRVTGQKESDVSRVKRGLTSLLLLPTCPSLHFFFFFFYLPVWIL